MTPRAGAKTALLPLLLAAGTALAACGAGAPNKEEVANAICAGAEVRWDDDGTKAVCKSSDMFAAQTVFYESASAVQAELNNLCSSSSMGTFRNQLYVGEDWIAIARSTKQATGAIDMGGAKACG